MARAENNFDRRSVIVAFKVSLKAMLKVLRKEAGGILVEFNGIENCIKGATVPAELQELFDSYSDIFQS